MHGVLAFGDQVCDEPAALTPKLDRKHAKAHLVSGESHANTRWVASRIGADSYRRNVCGPLRLSSTNGWITTVGFGVMIVIAGEAK